MGNGEGRFLRVFEVQVHSVGQSLSPEQGHVFVGGIALWQDHQAENRKVMAERLMAEKGDGGERWSRFDGAILGPLFNVNKFNPLA